MSQQINLFDPALRRKRELLTAAHLAVTALVLAVAMGGWGAMARSKLGALETQAQVLAPQSKGLQDQLLAAGKQLAEAKPDPRLATDLATAREVLALRDDVVAALKKGVGTEAVNFAEYLRGLARQSVSGLWLTGVTIGDGGAALEIRGRMTDPASLPDYIQRLNGEKSFRGLAFAALKVTQPVAQAPAGGQAAGTATTTAANRSPYHEFTLAPAKEITGQPPDVTGSLSPMKLPQAPGADPLPEGRP